MERFRPTKRQFPDYDAIGAWSPDTKRLASTSNRDGNLKI